MNESGRESIDAIKWHYRNLWRRDSLEPCVRPGMRLLKSRESGRNFCGGFSVVNSYVGEVWHYVFDVSNAAGSKDLQLQIYDEDFVQFQTFKLNIDVFPRVVTYAVVEGQILIASPDFPTLWGMVGSGVRYAVKQASENPNTTAINVPRGIVTAWNNRAVICSGASMFVSDPVAATGGDLRTFVAENQNARPGVIYGVHQGASGALFCLTPQGTYELGSDAAAVDVVGSNGSSWRLSSHNGATAYGSSAVWNGRVMAVNGEGWSFVDTEQDPGENIAEPIMPRAIGTRMSGPFNTYRMFSTADGPVICEPDDQSSVVVRGIYVHDINNDVRSWWTTPLNGGCLGLLTTLAGETMMIFNGGIRILGGNFDGQADTKTNASTTMAFVAMGARPGSPADNRTVRHVDGMAALGGSGAMTICSRGQSVSGTPPTDPDGITIGTDSWGTSTKRYTTTPFASVRGDFGAAATDDVSVEVAISALTVCNTRVSQVVDITYSESARNRPLTVAS